MADPCDNPFFAGDPSHATLLKARCRYSARFALVRLDTGGTVAGLCGVHRRTWLHRPWQWSNLLRIDQL